MLRLGREAQSVWLLGLTQIIGYGAFYYGFAILADDVAKEFAWTQAHFFGVFSLALAAGGLTIPFVGKAFDAYGAARLMAVGSLLSSASLALVALAPTPFIFGLSLAAVQVLSCFVLYEAAFTALVQTSARDGSRRIVYLTLIAGFASSIFWPLTSWLDVQLGWRATLLVFAALNLVVCVPVHMSLARRTRDTLSASADQRDDRHAVRSLTPKQLRMAMLLTTFGFALSSFTLSAVLAQMVPMLQAFGFGATSLAVSIFFGPAQVVVRFTNMIFGAKRHPLTITILAMSLLPWAFVVLAATAPATLGAAAFVILIGMGSGLKSIVQGTLPLALFGSRAYGARIGFMASFRYMTAALAPFAFASITEIHSAQFAAVVFAGFGVLGVACFMVIAWLIRRS